KIPYRVTLKDQSIFTAAGLWEVWQDNTGMKIYSFTILTRPASPSMEFLHDRMPVILPRDQEHTWLDESLNPIAFLKELPEIGTDQLKVYQVSLQVNNVRNNHKDLINEVTEMNQGKLF